jgi:hypothetical protein
VGALEPHREVVGAEPGLLEGGHNNLLLLLLLAEKSGGKAVLLLLLLGGPAALLLAALELLQQLVEVHNLQGRLGQRGGGGKGQDGTASWPAAVVLEGKRGSPCRRLSGQKCGGDGGGGRSWEAAEGWLRCCGRFIPRRLLLLENRLAGPLSIQLTCCSCLAGRGQIGPHGNAGRLRRLGRSVGDLNRTAGWPNNQAGAAAGRVAGRVAGGEVRESLRRRWG